MPFELFPTRQPHLQIGLWQIEEPAEELLARAPHLVDESRLAAIRKPGRQLEYLASRAALAELLTDAPQAALTRDAHGKPTLSHSSCHVSFSHTAGFGGAVVSKKPVGLDLEWLRPKAVLLAPKFLSATELAAAAGNELQCTLYWSAKEALYKLYGRKQLLFAEHLAVAPFPDLAGGFTAGTIQTNDTLLHCQIGYRVLANGLVLTWCEER